MMPASPRGMVYRCEVCGAEVTVLARQMENFEPVCCNRRMVRVRRLTAFYYCPVCGAEVAVLNRTEGEFEPVCCNRPMVREALRAAS